MAFRWDGCSRVGRLHPDRRASLIVLMSTSQESHHGKERDGEVAEGVAPSGGVTRGGLHAVEGDGGTLQEGRPVETR